MHSTTVLLTALVAAAIAIPSLAQPPNNCTPAGVWYTGGEQTKYRLTIIPEPGGDYTMIGVAAFSQANLGYPITTPFMNRLKRQRNG